MSSFFHRGWCHSSAHTHTCPHSPDVCNPWENRGTATGTGWPHTQPLLQEAHCTHTSLKGFSVNHHLILANGEKLQTRVEIGPAEPIQVKKQELCFFELEKELHSICSRKVGIWHWGAHEWIPNVSCSNPFPSSTSMTTSPSCNQQSGLMALSRLLHHPPCVHQHTPLPSLQLAFSKCKAPSTFTHWSGQQLPLVKCALVFKFFKITVLKNNS